MSLFQGFNINASALTANRFRMDVISANIANAETTRATYVNGEWQPYQRKMVELKPNGEGTFSSMLQRSLSNTQSSTQGVRVSGLKTDQTPFKLAYDPTHPDADQAGYVRLPNVDILKETMDMMSATRSYEANVTAMNATKNIMLKALEIGK